MAYYRIETDEQSRVVNLSIYNVFYDYDTYYFLIYFDWEHQGTDMIEIYHSITRNSFRFYFDSYEKIAQFFDTTISLDDDSHAVDIKTMTKEEIEENIKGIAIGIFNKFKDKYSDNEVFLKVYESEYGFYNFNKIPDWDGHIYQNRTNNYDYDLEITTKEYGKSLFRSILLLILIAIISCGIIYMVS